MAGTKRKRRTREQLEKICYQIMDTIETGVSAYQACKKHKLDHGNFYAIIRKNENLRERYLEARKFLADVQFSDMERMEEELKLGNINAKDFRALMDSMKWRLAKMNPRVYGDRQQVEATGTINIAHEITSARRRAGLLTTGENHTSEVGIVGAARQIGTATVTDVESVEHVENVETVETAEVVKPVERTSPSDIDPKRYKNMTPAEVVQMARFGRVVNDDDE